MEVRHIILIQIFLQKWIGSPLIHGTMKHLLAVMKWKCHSSKILSLHVVTEASLMRTTTDLCFVFLSQH
ncbi:hypothetical protein ABW06_22690 [Pluralibacter gergoviae]|uniref:Uncharacterized protein n=1 Tax=Pluralibacter gergoviae TaxID=61647 RepID=A0A0J5NRY4_PLUGE|nr:hypothetical protein ABW06_22690 [Pluralibacter gergoviae]